MSTQTKYLLYVLFVSSLLFSTCLAYSQKQNRHEYWNTKTQLKPFNFPILSEAPITLDLNGDGRQDALKGHIHDHISILWLDDDGNMRNGDTIGDFINDCILVDRNNDGKYDFIVKHVDLNDDEKADVQFILDYTIGGGEPKMWNSPHYMVVIDDDHDGVMNYVDWNTITLKCWEKNGLSDFYTDYRGNSTFLKMHRSTLDSFDLRYNWENPFIFYDFDNDGLTELALRFCDEPIPNEEAINAGFKKNQHCGHMGWFSMGIDMDNDNCPGNDFDFDMTLNYLSKNGFEYHDQSHILKNMRGLPEADKFFPDPRIRQLRELIYPDRNNAFQMAFNGNWESARFTWDEDDDCSRWERVELYDNKDAFKVGTRNGGVDNNPQSDPSGDRGEWDKDFSGQGNIYLAAFDGRIHLFGAERGVWRIDQNSDYFQGYDRQFQKKNPEKFATVEYIDSNENGFFDTINYDLDGDGKFETSVSLSALGIDDKCDVIDVSSLKYNDYLKLFKKVSSNMWENALSAIKVADSFGLDTFWYNKLKCPLSIREKYHYGWWLQFYIFKDLEYILSKSDVPNFEPNDLCRAYYTSNWKSLTK